MQVQNKNPGIRISFGKKYYSAKSAFESWYYLLNIVFFLVMGGGVVSYFFSLQYHVVETLAF